MSTSEFNQEFQLQDGEVIGVDNYVAPRLKPETYPGEFAPFLYSLQMGGSLYELYFDANSGTFAAQTEQGAIGIDDILAAHNLPLMSDRLPVTVFGSNRCPGQLADKFKPSEGEEPDPALNTIIMATGTLSGYDVVYNAKVGNMGYFFADLYQGPETQGTSVEVAIMFATPEQLRIIDDSEKAYDYTLIGEVEVGRRPDEDPATSRFIMPAYIHAGKATVYAGKTGKPVALAQIPATGRELVAKDQEEFQDDFFQTGDIEAKRQALVRVSGDLEIAATGLNYRRHMAIQRAGGLHKLAPRKEFQADLTAAMSEDESMVIDPTQFDVHKVDFDKDILPSFGQVAVLNTLLGRY